MSFSELIEVVAQDTKIPKTTVKVILESFTRQVLKAVLGGERVVMPHFGRFYHRDLKARPVFGGDKMSEARRIVRFKEARRENGETGSRAGSNEDEDGVPRGQVPEVRH